VKIYLSGHRGTRFQSAWHEALPWARTGSPDHWGRSTGIDQAADVRGALERPGLPVGGRGHDDPLDPELPQDLAELGGAAVVQERADVPLPSMVFIPSKNAARSNCTGTGVASVALSASTRAVRCSYTPRAQRHEEGQRLTSAKPSS